jgi:uncharacterized repeat protein (TIGR03803 family)
MNYYPTKHNLRTAAFLTTVFVCQFSAAAQYSLLHSFIAADGAGRTPQCELIVDGGVLYGTTASTTGDLGSLFKMNVDGTNLQVLHKFDSDPNGKWATGPLTLSGSTIFGTTVLGGSSDSTAYRINTDGSNFAILHSFTPGNPAITGVVVSGSNIYGSAGDDTGDVSMVYGMNTDGSNFVTIMKGVDTTIGDGRLSGLILDGSMLYGTMNRGPGLTPHGSVYRVSTDGTIREKLHTFTGGANDGSLPAYGQLLLEGSTLYGTTTRGGANNAGVVYKLNADGTGFELLHSFAGGPNDGFQPDGQLTLIGTRLYGMTFSGGSSNLGTIFSVNTDGSGFQLEHSFTGADGGNPYLGLTASGLTLYGVAATGGAENGGVVFSIAVPEPSSVVLLAMGAIGLLFPLVRRCVRARRWFGA